MSHDHSACSPKAISAASARANDGICSAIHCPHMINETLSSTVCLHCGSGIKSATSDAARSGFCCSGCMVVYGLMGQNGLLRFYTLRDGNPPTFPIPAKVAPGDFRYFDDPEFLKSTSANGARVRFFLEGMNCTACVWLLEKLPDFCPDAESARVDLAASTIEVVRTSNGSFASIATMLNQLGYQPHPLRENEASSSLQLRERRKDLIRIGIAGALTGNIMILTVSLYGGAEGDLEKSFQWLAAVLATPVLTYCAWPFYRSAMAAIRRRRLNLDVPIVVAILAGIATSAIALRDQTSATYFDSLSMLVFLLLSSRFFLRSIQNRHAQATNIEDDLLTGTMELVAADGVRRVSASSLEPGDCIVLESGTLIPIDGVVESGSGTVSAAVLTGESAHLQVSRESIVEAGFRTLSGSVVVRVTNPTRQTRLAGILRETEKMAAAKSAFVHFADRAAQFFIAVVFVSATLIALYFASSDPREGISRALALLIVTCPCVFGIAIPLSMAIAIRRAAREGIIVKSADAIELLWNAENFFFDKTATLTTGALQVVQASYSRLNDIEIVHGLEKNQSHPVARALTSYAQTVNAKAAGMDQVEALSNGGMTGLLNGNRYSVRPVRRVSTVNNRGGLVSSFQLLKNDEPVSDFDLCDQPREEAASVLEALRSQNRNTFLLSGDRIPAVDECARVLKFPNANVFAEMTPELKAEKIKEYPKNSVMIGDGANDAAAFASAGVGIAVFGSLDVSLRAADVYLTRPNLGSILKLLEISRDAKAAIYRNLAFSAGFNLTAGAIAAMGYMSPLWAAVIMPMSSLTVLFSASWSRRR